MFIEFCRRTEPEAFFLEVYFNAHPTVSPDGKEKPKPTNALVPTVIAYAGGRMSFSVNMSRGVIAFPYSHAAELTSSTDRHTADDRQRRV